MAQYFTDFSGDTIDAVPSGWTLRYQSVSTDWLVKAKTGATGGKILKTGQNVGPIQGISFDAVDADANRDDIEVIFRFMNPAGIGSANISALARGDATSGDGNVNGFAGGIDNGVQQKRIARYDGSSPTTIGSAAFSAAANTWFIAQYRANSDQHKLRVWRESDGKPVAWDVEVTDPNDLLAGVCGLVTSKPSNLEIDYVGFGTNGDAAPTEPVATGPSITAPASISPGATTTFSTSGFVDPLTGVRITDAQGNVKELTLASQTSLSAPAVGDLDYALFGDVTLEVYNATESATATIAFNPPAGFDQIALEAGFATDINSFLYQYGGTPAVPDQFTYDPVSSGTAETLTLQTNGYWTATGYGEWTVHTIDATDGYMEPFQFIWNAQSGGSLVRWARGPRFRAPVNRALARQPGAKTL